MNPWSSSFSNNFSSILSSSFSSVFTILRYVFNIFFWFELQFYLFNIGTLESSNDPDEAYETINISKIKAYTPNLKVKIRYSKKKLVCHSTSIKNNHL